MKIFYFILFLLPFSLIAQSEQLFGLIDNRLVEVDPLAPSVNEISGYSYPQGLAELTYSPSQCAFFSIADNIGEPRLIKLLEDGTLEDIGALSMANSTIFTCEALEYNAADGLLYAFGSLDGQELFAESLFTINPITAECQFTTRMIFNSGERADADNMDFRDGTLYINDGIVADGITDFYSIALVDLVNPTVTPNFLGRTGYYSVTDQAVFLGNYVFPTAERDLFLVDTEDLSVTNSGQAYSSTEFNGNTLTGLSTKPISRDTTIYPICSSPPIQLNGEVYLTAGTYIQNLATINGCDSTLIVIAQEERIEIELDTLICPNAPFLIRGVQVMEPGIYQDTSSTGFCDTVFSITVRFLENQASFLGPDTTVCGTSYILNNQALLVSWEDGFAESSRSITESGTYIATINNSSGCTITDTVVVNLEGSGTAYLPNAFSPNNDNKNDKLCLFSSDELAIMNYLMRVYDRWGKLLFESDDVTTGWDGESNGKPLNSGTYLAIVSFSQEGCSTPVEIAELVHLLR